jgi:uncharacterized protein (TIGR03118 family)
MSLRLPTFRSLAVLAAAASGAAIAIPAVAFADTSNTAGESLSRPLAVHEVDMASDVPGLAPLTDPDLVNPWGLALSPTSPLWSANAGTDTATVYSSPADATTVTKSAVRVTLPSPAIPTGQVANTTSGFVESSATGTGPARFIFSTITGHIEAWNPQADSTLGPAEVKATVPGAVYTGLALATAQAGPQLYAADFSQGRIDVFDSSYSRVATQSWQFNDSTLPRGFVPFNVQALNGNIFVTYAKPDPTSGEAMAGDGLGFVDEYTADGSMVGRIASRGDLNAPWGLAIAPAAWGNLAGSLLVGDFGDGRVNVIPSNGAGGFDDHNATQLRNAATGKKLSIPGLWSLTAGTAAAGGTDSMWFSAGIDNEQHGLIGVLRVS